MHTCTNTVPVFTLSELNCFYVIFWLFCFAFNCRKTVKLTAEYFYSALNTLFFGFFIYAVVLPLRAKRKVIEIYLIGKRLEEEIPLLEDKIVRCLKYYRDKVMPSLTSDLNSLDKGMWFSL